MYRRIIISIMFFMGFYTIGCFFTIVLQCTNLAVQWDPTVKATCWSAYTIKTLSYVNVSLNIVTDILFSIVIPIPLLWSLQMNKRQKSSLMCILGLGVLYVPQSLPFPSPSTHPPPKPPAPTNTPQRHSSSPSKSLLHPLVRQDRRLALGQPQPNNLDRGRVQHRHHRGQPAVSETAVPRGARQHVRTGQPQGECAAVRVWESSVWRGLKERHREGLGHADEQQDCRRGP